MPFILLRVRFLLLSRPWLSRAEGRRHNFPFLLSFFLPASCLLALDEEKEKEETKSPL